MDTSIRTSMKMRASAVSIRDWLNLLDECEKQPYTRGNYCQCRIADLKLSINGKSVSKEQIIAMSDDNNTIEVEADMEGPYGGRYRLTELRMFQTMADLVPDGWFEALSVGSYADIEAEVYLRGQMVDGKLYLYEASVDSRAVAKAFEQSFRNRLSYEDFCRIFNVNRTSFTDEAYSSFILEFFADRQNFKEALDTKRGIIMFFDFYLGMQSLEKFEYDDYYYFRDRFFDENTEFSVYDPLSENNIR